MTDSAQANLTTHLGYDAHLAACLEKLQAGDLAAVIDLCKAALDRNPQDGGAYDIAGLAYCQAAMSGHNDAATLTDQARDAFLKAVECPGPSYLFYVHAAQTLFALYRWEEALAMIQRAVAIFPRQGDLMILHAMLLGYCGRGAEALRVYQDLAAQLPAQLFQEMIKSFRQIAYAMHLSGDLQAALTVFDDLYKRDGGFIESNGPQYVSLLKAVGRSSDCETVTARMRASADKQVNGPQRRISAFEREGQYDAAEVLWRELIDQDPTSADARFGLANHLGLRGRWDECGAQLEHARILIGPSGAHSKGQRALAAQIESLHRAVTVYVPRMRQLMAAAVDPPRTPGKDIIVIRGGLDAMNAGIVKVYRAVHRNVFIILSTWDDTAPEVLADVRAYADDVVLNRRPETPGFANGNFQITCAAAGLRKAKALGAERVLVTRTDVALLNENMIPECAQMLEAHKPDARATPGLKRRIIVSEIFTAKMPFYHVSDVVCYGTIDDVLNYWSPEGHAQTCLRLEVFLTLRLAAKVGRATRNDFDTSWTTIRDMFIVRAADSLQWFWQKYPAVSSIATGMPCWTDSELRENVTQKFFLDRARLPRLGA